MQTRKKHTLIELFKLINNSRNVLRTRKLIHYFLNINQKNVIWFLKVRFHSILKNPISASLVLLHNSLNLSKRVKLIHLLPKSVQRLHPRTRDICLQINKMYKVYQNYPNVFYVLCCIFLAMLLICLYGIGIDMMIRMYYYLSMLSIFKSLTGGRGVKGRRSRRGGRGQCIDNTSTLSCIISILYFLYTKVFRNRKCRAFFYSLIRTQKPRIHKASNQKVTNEGSCRNKSG